MGRPIYAARKDSTSHRVVRTWLSQHNCSHRDKFGAGVFFYHGGFFAGYPLYAVDVSTIGGWVDWLMWLGEPERNVSCAWECKEEKKESELTEGEKGWREFGPTRFFIVTTLEDCDQAAGEAQQALIALGINPRL